MSADDIEQEIASIEQGLVDLLNRLHRVRQRASAPVPEVSVDRNERRYVPGPLPPEWKHASKLADLLKVSTDTAWRLAWAAEAQWKLGKARRVDMSKFREVLPNLR